MKEGWTYKKLAEVCDFISGYTPNNKELNSIGGIPYFKVSDMNRKENMMFMTKTELYVSNPKKIIPSGAIVFPKNGGAIYTGKKRVLKYDSIVDLNTEAICNKSSLIRTDFLFKFIFYLDLGKFDKGGALPSLNINKMKDFLMSVPPLSEQQRIVSYLDSAFAKIDAVAKNAEKSLNQAKALFQSALAKMMEPKEGWEEKNLVEELKLKSGEYLPSKEHAGGSIPVYGGNGIAGFHNEGNLDGEYIIIGRVGALCGNVHLTNGEVWVTDNAFVATGLDEAWDKKFLLYELTSIDLNKYATKAVQPVISNKSLREVSLYKPSLDVQNDITKTLENVENNISSLSSNLSRTLTECAALKQSILRQTFE